MPTSHHRPSRISDESGVALIYALLVVVIVGGIVAITFASALSETRQSAFEADFEDTLHVAEAGADIVLQELVTDVEFGNATDPAAFAGTEYEWAIDEASDPAVTPVRVGEGEVVGLRPSSGTTEFVYGVGFVPSRAAFLAGTGEPYARVVRMEVGFDDNPAPGTYFFLADQVVNFNGGGNSSIYGSNGNVHTNGTLDTPSSANFAVSGIVSYFGSCNGDCISDANITYLETTTTVPLNVGSPTDVYGSDAARDYVANGGDWYDYCSGVWRNRDVADQAPCAGSNVGGNPPGFSGTNMNGTPSGVYWFQGNVNITRNDTDGRFTIITGGNISNPGGNRSFDWQPSYPGLHAYAGGDFDFNNSNVNADSSPSICDMTNAQRVAWAANFDAGLIYAGNDIIFSGNPTAAQIGFLADDTIIVNGGGNGCAMLEGDASSDLAGPGQPLVLQWDELRR